ncbi:hypothetical protein ABEY43_06380 [Priestia megaterium]
MSFFNKNLPQPIHIFKRLGTQDNPHLDIKESLEMTTNRIILKEIPVEYYKVLVMDSTSNYFFEEKSVTDVKEGSFFVDYTHGIVTFHESVVGQMLHFTYKGGGFILLSADRIFTHGVDGLVEETLQEVIDNCKTSVESYRQLIEYKVQLINQKIIEAQSAVDNANSAALQTRQATADYQKVVESSKKNYKEMVDTYGDIATTYPNPEIGWTVPVKDIKLSYRWDGSTWVCVETAEMQDGFNVFTSSIPPDNINLLWVKTSTNVGGTYGRVITSDTAPENKNFIWWKKD